MFKPRKLQNGSGKTIVFNFFNFLNFFNFFNFLNFFNFFNFPYFRKLSQLTSEQVDKLLLSLYIADRLSTCQLVLSPTGHLELTLRPLGEVGSGIEVDECLLIRQIFLNILKYIGNTCSLHA